jgi:uncharacterized protein (TIGR00369 family)
MSATVIRADGYEPLDEERSARWRNYGQWDRVYFPRLLGLVVEDVRRDYCRMRLPFRSELEQPAGIVHGGAIASVIDSVVVPAIGSVYDADIGFATINLQVQYMGALRQEDAIAEGWVVQRGRSIVFCEAEVLGSTSGRVIARGQMTYKISRTST